MIRIITIIGLLLLYTSISTIAQDISGADLLQKSIAYHDPGGNWETFADSLKIKLEMADGSIRYSHINIELPEEKFYLKILRDTSETTYALIKEKCITSVIDSTNASRTPCETAHLYKDYYTYLYGLPMKLMDPGTNVHQKVENKTFKGKQYLVLKVTYEEGVGSDVWQFYFDPETYAMEIYQFFKGDPKGEGANTGEYILLSELKTISGIKMPKVRAWYYNKDDKYLGTDILID